MSTQPQAGYALPDLPYAYNALEPQIDARTMEIHHQKHHGGYVAKLNAALEGQPQFAGLEISELLKKINAVPESIRQAVINNGGGHANHSLFWSIMSKNGGGEPDGDLAAAINTAFGGFDAFKEQFTNAALTRFGSGWAWLGFDAGGKLHVGSTANQDSPYMHGHLPILGLDVWEHAYYLNYQNRRPDYVQAWWNLVDWGKVGELYQAGK
ncbi:superoxide dismutase [bacterium]|nr:superoxide dismutase [bacterium]